MSNNPISIQDVQQGKQITKQTATPPVPSSAFSNAESFELLQRIARLFSASMLVPKQYQGSDGLPNCIIAINMANRIGADPLMTMQNLYVVHGRPAWSGQFVIAAINQSGRFAEPLHFEFVGERGSDSWGCYATTVTASGRQITGPTVTIGIAKAEGWYGRDGSKWKTVPELMIRYRAGAWFGRTECPEILMGFPSEDEVRDVIDIDPTTGNVIDNTFQAPSGGAPAARAQETDQVERGDTTGAQAEFEAQIKARGFYQEGNRYINVHGDLWDQSVHATGSEGQPIVNSDGTFRARRGTAKAGAQQQHQDDGTGQTQAAPAPAAHPSQGPVTYPQSENPGYGLD